jgi:hypothetical protein
MGVINSFYLYYIFWRLDDCDGSAVAATVPSGVAVFAPKVYRCVSEVTVILNIVLI